VTAVEPLEGLEARLRAFRPAAGPEPPQKRAAVAAVLRRSAGATDVLLMTRAEHPRDPWSGQVSLPGGRHDPTCDADLFATAVRETREELGLDLGAAELLCRLAPIQARTRGTLLPMDVTPFVFRLAVPAALTLGAEAREAFWLPLASVLSGELDATHRYERDGLVHELPSWRYGGRVVWGMTHRLIRALLDAGGMGS
jgi:8-oxo-dGTP pyrophosphatase MutT (NUDIX family)